MKVDSLLKLIEIERKSRIDKFNPSSKYISQAYLNVIALVKESFKSGEEVTNKKISELNLSDGMKKKLEKMLKKKIPKIINKKMELINDLVKYLGLGLKKAEILINNGLTSVSQLTQKKYYDTLPLETRTIIETNPLRKIPYAKIKVIEKILTNVCGYKAIIVGSYRRKAVYSRDIDVMIVSDSVNSLDDYIHTLSKKFTVIIYKKGPNKMSLVLKGSKTDGNYYKLDVFLTLKKNTDAMLLYSTGPKLFNIRMRAKAKSLGYLLNHEGLYSLKSAKKIKVSNERDFFTLLEMDYIVPEKR